MTHSLPALRIGDDYTADGLSASVEKIDGNYFLQVSGLSYRIECVTAYTHRKINDKKKPVKSRAVVVVVMQKKRVKNYILEPSPIEDGKGGV